MDQLGIKKLAAMLKVSKSTVSRAFFENSGIKEETKQRVLSLAAELSFTPSFYGSNLRRKNSNTIAVVVPEISNNFFSQAIKGIEEILSKHNYNVLIYVTDSDGLKEADFISTINSGKVDGIIMSASAEEYNHEYISNLKRSKIPVVFFDRVYDDIEAPKVITNDYDISFDATELLIKAGCTKIVFLVVNKAISIGNSRMCGYLDAMKKHQLIQDESCVIDCSNDFQKNYSIIGNCLDNLKPDGIFCSIERLAIATYHLCIDRNINIPNDLKVISFSSLEIAPLLNPALSTITQPALEMGLKAASLLIKCIREPGINNVVTNVLESKIIERESTRQRVIK
ncbi:MAG: LacI family transcriptional regulator [Sphingobacteriales bacterium]|nr:LacI family transcriptional regulator [Sphingobacteriales bacterium]